MEYTIATQIHGRILVREGKGGLLVGFHGYGENAERHMAELERIPGTADWTLVAVQGLHRFYNQKTGEVVASWMTKENRELAIADNISYVGNVLRALATARPLVFVGFSQGAAMAYRAGAALQCDGVIVHGGDLPPNVAELDSPLPPVLVGRGSRDEWYSAQKLEQDLSFLQRVTRVTACVFDGGHEWTDEFRMAAGEFLRGMTSAA